MIASEVGTIEVVAASRALQYLAFSAHSVKQSRASSQRLPSFSCTIISLLALYSYQTMKALRKSLGSAKDHHSSHHISTPITSPTLSKAVINLPPPTRVIRATSKYRSQAPQQLSFEKGDFFHVLRDVDSQGLWYEAHNPITGARGLVPRAMFEEFSKGNPTYACLWFINRLATQWLLILILHFYVVPGHPHLVLPRKDLPQHLRRSRLRFSTR